MRRGKARAPPSMWHVTSGMRPLRREEPSPRGAPGGASPLRSHAATSRDVCERLRHVSLSLARVEVTSALLSARTHLLPDLPPCSPGRGPCSGWTSPVPLSLREALAQGGGSDRGRPGAQLGVMASGRAVGPLRL